MSDVAIFFDNGIDQVPFVLASQNGTTRIHRNFHRFRLTPGTITIGYGDAIDSIRRLGAPPPGEQRRIEVLFALTIGFSKGDSPGRWQARKQDMIGSTITPELLESLKTYENATIGWDEFSPELFRVKDNLIAAVLGKYRQLESSYIGASVTRAGWLVTEHRVDSYFLARQFEGVRVNNDRIEKLLRELNYEKYASLLYLEEEHSLDLSGVYLSDEYISSFVLSEVKDEEKNEELSDLVEKLDEDNRRIEAVRKVRECRMDFSNLIKHYTVGESEFVYPQYQTVASSSGRIFIASPGTQYLKKARRDIFSACEGSRLSYFDFRNYEPGIAAGLSGDPSFQEYYNPGDMYLRIATEEYREPALRKCVKIAVLATLYGMSETSLRKHFSSSPAFDPGKVLDKLASFSLFQEWQRGIVENALAAREIHHESYTRRFLPERLWKARTSSLNHVIQSTGSVILKKCILSVASIPGVRVLVPMHDALLCECPNSGYLTTEASIISAMEAIFCETVSGLTSKVVVSAFSE